MATQGPNNPGTLEDDATVGSYAWGNPEKAASSNNDYATATAIGTTSTYFCGATGVQDYLIKLVKGGTIGGNSVSISACFPSSDTYSTYGGAANLWGNTLTVGDVNATNFGVAFSALNSKGSEYGITHYLKATNFGFTIPAGSTINGVVVEVEKKAGTGNGDNAYIDHIRMTIYYTEGEPTGYSSPFPSFKRI